MVPSRNHGEIRRWADRFGAVPAEIKPRKFDGQPAILCFLFGKAGQGTPELQPISWDCFFAQFDLLKLAFAYDQEAPRFNIFKVEKSAQAQTCRCVWAGFAIRAELEGCVVEPFISRKDELAAGRFEAARTM